VSNTDELIADALHDLAAQAVPVPPAADALWRAGQRRRRLSVLATSAAAGAIVGALVVALTVGGLGVGHRGGGPAAPAPAAPVWLRAPLVFAQVAAASRPPCAVHSAKVLAPNPPACLRLGGVRMTVTRIESARVHQFHGEDLLEIRLTPADSRRFATLTRKLARMPSPHNVLATVIGGQIVDHPVVIRAVTTRWVGFTGFSNRAAVEYALRSLLAGSRP
jgi:hypothetical protein